MISYADFGTNTSLDFYKSRNFGKETKVFIIILQVAEKNDNLYVEEPILYKKLSLKRTK